MTAPADRDRSRTRRQAPKGCCAARHRRRVAQQVISYPAGNGACRTRFFRLVPQRLRVRPMAVSRFRTRWDLPDPAGISRRCSSGAYLDDGVTGLVLTALAPAALEVSLATAEKHNRGAVDKIWRQHLKRADYEVDRARCCYRLAEPETSWSSNCRPIGNPHSPPARRCAATTTIASPPRRLAPSPPPRKSRSTPPRVHRHVLGLSVSESSAQMFEFHALPLTLDPGSGEPAEPVD